MSKINVFMIQFLFLTCSFIMVLLHFYLEPYKWKKVYLGLIRSNTDNHYNKIRDIIFSTSLLTYFLPFKIGIPIRMVLFNKIAGIKVFPVSVVLAWDSIISLVIWGGGASICAYMLRWEIKSYISMFEDFSSVYFLVSLFFLILCLLGMMFFKRVNKFYRVKFIGKREALLVASILALDVFSYYFRHFFLTLVFVRDVKVAVFVGFSGVLATFIGMLSGLPMGILGYDLALLALASGFGLNQEQALLIIVINRAFNFLSAVVLGLPASKRLGIGSSVRTMILNVKDIWRKNETK